MPRNRSILGIELAIDWQLLLWLSLGFFICTIGGTLLHELGHIAVARYFGFHTHLGFAYMNFRYAPDGKPVEVSHLQKVWICLGGPLQTMLTGTLGLIVMQLNVRSFRAVERLQAWQWLLVFITLFWIRQPANMAGLVIRWASTSRMAVGDEIKLAYYAGLPRESVVIATGIIGALVLSVVIYRFIPVAQRLTLIFSGLAGAVVGVVVWFWWAGPILMP